MLGLTLAWPATPSGAQDFSKLKFMSGCWEGAMGKDQVVEENWTSPSENLLLAVTRYLTKKQATNWEFTRIEKSDSLTAFIAQSMGEAPDTFALKTLVDEVAIFENPLKDFPKRIMYRLTSDGSLIARLEDDSPMGERDFEIKLSRVKCPGH